MEDQSEQDRDDEAETDHNNMIVEYVGSDPVHSGGCLGVIGFAVTVGTLASYHFLS